MGKELEMEGELRRASIFAPKKENLQSFYARICCHF
jgi:hypothetical protein